MTGITPSETSTTAPAGPIASFTLPLLAVLFFCSGASALVYQVVWLRQLGLVFGVTVFAASTVWASFMGGLAIGSLLAGRVADRVRRPLVWFAGAEALIGISALLTPLGLRILQEWYVAIYAGSPPSAPMLAVIRVGMTLVVLFVPTLLMGSTLPLVVKSSLGRSAQLGPRVGVLYGTNTAGAIVGTLVAGLVLIPHLGLSGALLSAACLNLLVACVAGAFALLTREQPAEVQARPAISGASLSSGAVSANARRAVLLVFTLSGLASLALEVVWFRVIVLLIRPTVYGFSMMLATLLFGIAAGSYLALPLLRRRVPRIAPIALFELSLAVVALFSLQLLQLHSTVLAATEAWIQPLLPEYQAFAVVAAVLTILPSALLMGIAFPLGLEVWADRAEGASDDVARRVGVFYSLNVAGGIVGSLAAGFLLLPLLGSRATLVLICAVILGSGLLLLRFSEWSRAMRWCTAAGFAAAFAAGAVSIESPFELVLRLRHPGQQLLWREEGVQATVSVHRAGDHLVLNLEGNHQASDLPGSIRTHRAIGHLPMVLHPEARDALVIGLGGGATAGAVSLHTGATVDVVELAGGVVRAAEFFTHANHGVLTRPNVRLIVDDGRNHLMTTSRRYDVITADLILPIYSGSGNLYSAEYFRLVRNALKDDGLVLQWVWGTEAEYKTIMRTFLSVFPDATLWHGGSLMVAGRKPLVLRRSDFSWKLEAPGRREALLEMGFDSFERLLADFQAGPNEMRAFVGEGPILTDDRPLTEYFLSLPRDREIDVTGLRGDVRPLLR